MIALAEVDERADPLGCRYVREDAAAFTPAAPVDIVTAVYLLNYARRILPTVADFRPRTKKRIRDIPGYAGDIVGCAPRGSVATSGRRLQDGRSLTTTGPDPPSCPATIRSNGVSSNQDSSSCVRWYLRYAVSYRDLEEMMRERGLCVDHTTIYRWVQRYAPEIDKRCRPFLRRTTDSYRIDETYVRVGGAWHYLYRGVDSNGDTLDFLLRATRDRNAAIAFFRKTVGASHTPPPRVVNVDKNPASPIAFEAIKHEGFFRPRSSLRQCKYLNNVIEPDHRFIKRRPRPMLGFKPFTTAWRTVRGIEMMHALRKGQARWMAKGDVVGQTRLIHKVFGLAV